LCSKCEGALRRKGCKGGTAEGKWTMLLADFRKRFSASLMGLRGVGGSANAMNAAYGSGSERARPRAATGQLCPAPSLPHPSTHFQAVRAPPSPSRTTHMAPWVPWKCCPARTPPPLPQCPCPTPSTPGRGLPRPFPRWQ
jgi:hypothetical protein